MIYRNAGEWRGAGTKRVLLFGMSGLGKTHLSDLLRRSGEWFHYSVDYRIGTRYLGEHIVDNFKRVAMRQPFLRELLMSDSIYIASNITFSNLAPLSTWLGKPGDPEKGGLPFDEYLRRQALHREAEVAALLDTVRFIDRARDLYGYDHFVCDSSGSICEVVDPDDPADPILTALDRHVLFVHIEGTPAHVEELVRRFDRAPKPMYYPPGILEAEWNAHLAETGGTAGRVDPDAFVRWTYRRALDRREPVYRRLAAKWGVTVAAADVAEVRTAGEAVEMIAAALEARA
jgi:hypothetical protein